VVPWLTLQPEPGALNETALQALDQLVSLAAGHGIRLNITMAGGGAQLWLLFLGAALLRASRPPSQQLSHPIP
jgi:hypothetical protein